MDNGPGLDQQVPAEEVWSGNQTAVADAGASDAGAGALAAVAGAGAPQIFGMMAIFCLMREMNGDNDEAIKTDEIAREAKAEKLNIHKKMKTENVGGVVNSSNLTVPMMALLAAMISLGKSEPVRDDAVCIYEQMFAIANLPPGKCSQLRIFPRGNVRTFHVSHFAFVLFSPTDMLEVIAHKT